MTEKNSEGGIKFSAGPEVFYVDGTQGYVNNDVLAGPGVSVSAGIGLGVEYSQDVPKGG